MRSKLKNLIACLMLAICFMLTACVSDPGSYYFDYNELKDNVVSVELINYDILDVKTVRKKEDILPFDFDKMEIIKTLELEQKESFLEDLPKIHFHICDNWTRYTSSAKGICIRIIYTSGNFVILCLDQEINFVGEFTVDGSVESLNAYFVDNIHLEGFVDKYLSQYLIS